MGSPKKSIVTKKSVSKAKKDVTGTGKRTFFSLQEDLALMKVFFFLVLRLFSLYIDHFSFINTCLRAIFSSLTLVGTESPKI